MQNISWTELTRILIERFPNKNTADPMEQLQTLKQVPTVNNYIDTYENWMQLMKREKPYLLPDLFVDRFISGLKDNIKHTVQIQKPSSLASAYWYARKYEKAYLSGTRRAPPQQNTFIRPP